MIDNNQSGIPVGSGSLPRPSQQSINQTFPNNVGTLEDIIANPKVGSYLSTIDGIIDSIIRDVNQIVSEKQQALDIANSKEKSLLVEHEQMKLEMEKMKRLHLINQSFHKERIE